MIRFQFDMHTYINCCSCSNVLEVPYTHVEFIIFMMSYKYCVKSPLKMENKERVKKPV